MKLVRFVTLDGKEKYGTVEENSIFVAKGAPWGKIKSTNEKHDIRMVKILPPCEPTKIICLGLNYKDHAKELDMPVPSEPIIFLKPVSSIIAHQETIIYPKQSKKVDYEAELAIVIKKESKDLQPENAIESVLGYTCLNDITARDLQEKDGQWTRSKSFDTFCPVGPYISIANEINPNNLQIELCLNGEVKQTSNTNNFIFPIEKIVSFVSKIMTLYPGDIISTGTPSGVGQINKGDIVEVKIENIGTLKNYVN